MQPIDIQQLADWNLKSQDLVAFVFDATFWNREPTIWKSLLFFGQAVCYDKFEIFGQGNIFGFERIEVNQLCFSGLCKETNWLVHTASASSNVSLGFGTSICQSSSIRFWTKIIGLLKD